MPATTGKEIERRFPILLLIAFVFPFIISCHHANRAKKPITVHSGVTDDDIAAQLENVFKRVDTGAIKLRTTADNVRYAYQLNEFGPLWLSDNHKAAGEYLKELEDIKWDGLNPERYNLAKLKGLYDKLNNKSSESELIAFDTAFTYSYLAAAHDLLMGEILPKKADSLWYHPNDSIWNAPELLAKSEQYASLKEYRSTVPTYAILRDEYKKYYQLDKDQSLKDAIAAVSNGRNDSAANKIITAEMPWIQTGQTDTLSEQQQMYMAFQDNTALKLTGKPDSATVARLTMQPAEIMKVLKANMERVRWMQKQFGDLYVVVDVPMMELFLRKDGGNAMHMRVVVGKPIRQTPSIGANMANIVINPPWGVPPTILKKDVLPGITKSGQRYLSKKGLKAYDKKGHYVNASSINAGNYRRYNYKQAPGDDNALGYVKFNLPNPWDIYLHDTPHRGDFVKSYRALSSGCVRLQQPQQMALYILGELEKKKYDQQILDSMIETHKTRWEVLKNKIPVHIVYLTAFEDTTGKHVRFTRDIYKRDEKLITLLN